MSKTKSTAMDPAEELYLEELAKHEVINETSARGDSVVQQFYAGAVVLLTGGSGFLGKQLIEKLFRSCDIRKIYVLLRPKKQKTLKERLDYILKDELYEYLYKNKPDFVNKLIPVAGDIIDNRLSLSEENWTLLTEEVNVIFHVAATVNFLESLNVATLTNVRGTREMLKLAKACKKLKSFVHVSTAYSHATPERVKQPVLEQFYQSPISPQLLIDLAEQFDQEMMNDIAPKLLKNWPNSYAFTKAVAEDLVRTMAPELPICIVRPAIVMQAYREPPGWADRGTMHSSAIGFIVGMCIGGLHTIYARANTHLDIVPVDIVNNALIVAGQQTAEEHNHGQKDVKIYTVSRYRNPFIFKRLADILDSKKCRSFVSPKMLWYAYVLPTSNRLIFFLLTWLLHFIPGYLADGILMLLGKKTKAIRLYDKAYKQNKVFGFYLTNEWQFEDSNLFKIRQNLSPADAVIFECDAATVNIEHHSLNSVLGSRKYIIKDGLQGTLNARNRYFWLGVLNAIYLTLYAYLLWKILCLPIYGILKFLLHFVF